MVARYWQILTVGSYSCLNERKRSMTVKPISHDPVYVALKSNSKIPAHTNWSNNPILYEDAVSHGGNIGLVLGRTSGFLDVDLDSSEAKALASVILPTPLYQFDWGSPKSGHYLYRAQSFGPTIMFSSNNGNLLELRGDNVQTMIPPSIHPSGKLLTFNKVNEAARDVEYEELKRCASLLSACAEITQHWLPGKRHNLVLSFAGLCLKLGLDPQLMMNIIQRICRFAQDHDEEDRLNCVRTSASKPINKISGYVELSKLIGDEAAQRISDRVMGYCPNVINTFESSGERDASTLRLERFSDSSNVTEAKLGETFARWLDEKAVYATEGKQWFIWNGNAWKPDECGLIIKLAYKFICQAKEFLFENQLNSAVANLTAYESLNRLDNLCRIAATDRATTLNAFDNDQMLLGTPNKLINLRNGEVHDPDPSKLISKLTGTSYHEGSDCPHFKQFLADIFEGDTDLITYVKRMSGYILTGEVPEQCLFIFIGDGANGKSTFLSILNQLLGDYAKTAASQTLIAKTNNSIGDDLVDLMGARLISVTETEEGAALAEAKIKLMTGGDKVKGRPLYGKFVEFPMTGKIILATNSLPQISNTDHGIWRRIKAIPFNRTFNADEQDKNLTKTLTKELPGILNWAIEGCLEWQKYGLNPPKVVLDQVSEYKTEMDSITQFVDEVCELNQATSCSASRLYEAYRSYCQAVGSKCQSSSAFKKALNKLPNIYQKRTSSGMHWYGIRPVMHF